MLNKLPYRVDNRREQSFDDGLSLEVIFAAKELYNFEDDQMNKDKEASDLAKEFFTAGNIVVGFYVAQTLLFINSIPKVLDLWKILSGGKIYAVLGTLIIAVLYIIIIGLCSFEEARLRKVDGQSDAVCHAVRWAGLIRILIVVIVAVVCASLLGQLKSPTESQSAATQHQK